MRRKADFINKNIFSKRMRIVHQDIKNNTIKVTIDSLDDLWYLSQIVEPGDVVKGQTERKIKLNAEGDRNAKIIIKHITVSIIVEKVEFHKYNNTLRISGKINEEYEDIPKGSYHTLAIEQGTAITIAKEQFFKHHLDQLKEAATQKQTMILLCAFDREQATFAQLKRYGYDLLAELHGDVQKKQFQDKHETSFYKEIAKQIQAYDQQKKPATIIVGSPAFWKEYLLKELKNTAVEKKIITAACSGAGEMGIKELLKRQEVQQALQHDRITKEINAIEMLCAEIAKNGLIEYGRMQVRQAAEQGAVKTLFITDSFLQKEREQNTYHEINSLIKAVDSAKGTIMIVSADHEGGRKLNGLGGIAALLRYKLG